MSLFTGAIAGALALAGAGAKGAFDIYGASKTSNAAEHAADVQAKAAQDALDFTKAQKAKQEAAYAPFAALGQQAATALPGLARQGPTMGPPMPYTTQPRATQGAPLSAMGAPTNMPASAPLPPTPQPTMAGAVPSGPMVTLQAPDGTTKAVPQSQVQFYISRGARPVR